MSGRSSNRHRRGTSRSRSRSRSPRRRTDYDRRDYHEGRDRYGERGGRDTDRERHREHRDYRERSRSRSRQRENPRTRDSRKDEPRYDKLEKKSTLASLELHPLLSQDIDTNKLQAGPVPFIPKASTSSVMANQRAAASLVPRAVTKSKRKGEEAEADPVAAFLSIKPEEPSKSNPYFDHRLTVASKPHAARPIHFHQKGKFMAQGSHMRKEAQMEILRREIAESSMATGLDTDLVADLLLGTDALPKVEWWDLPFLPNGSYGDPPNVSIINSLIQRPALIEPPADPNVYVPPKPLALTKEEAKKMRRQRRLHEQKDRQEKIRLGLLPPDEPKVRLANLVNVLASESVQEPSKVEAEIKAKAAARHQEHLKTNEERKLQAAEARHSKPRQDLNGTPCIPVSVYKVIRLDRKQWKFKVKINAQQNELTGCCIMSPKTNIIVVEGLAKGQKHYRNLLTRRIDWNEVDTQEADSPIVDDMVPNSCELLWEGMVSNRSWRYFEMKEVPADIDVKDYFASRGLEQYWNLSKST